MKHLRLLAAATLSVTACRGSELAAPDRSMPTGPQPTFARAPSTETFAAYLSDAGTNSVLVVGQSSHDTITVIPVGATPGASASSPDGKRVYVVLGGVQQLAVIRTSDNTVLATLPLPGSGATGVVVSPDNKSVYVANRSGSISVIDATALTLLPAIPVSGITPYMLDVSPDGTHLYVGDNVGFWLGVVNLGTRAVQGLPAVGFRSWSVAASADGQFVYSATNDGLTRFHTSNNVVDSFGFPGTPVGVAVAPDNQHVFVAVHDRSTVRVFNVVTSGWTLVPLTNAFLPKVTADGRWVYVTQPESNLITVLDAQTYAVSATIPVNNPQGVSFAPVAPTSLPTATSIVSSIQPSFAGQNVQFTATVTGNNAPVTIGQLSFRLGGTSCADAVTFAGPMSLDANGKATASRTFNGSGSPFVVRACYDGATTASQFLSSEGAVSQTVNPAPTATVITSSIQPSVTGQLVQFTATVMSGGTPVTVGRLTFRVGGTACSDAVTFAGFVSLDANGKASASHAFSGSTTPLVVRACYDGTTTASQFLSSDGAVTQTVNPAPTTTSVASSAQPSVTGQMVQFTATVMNGATPVTVGQLTFRLGGTACSDAVTFAGPMSLGANGTATTSRTFTASDSPFTVRACYDGTTSASQFLSSEGAATQTVNPARVRVSAAVTPSTQQYSDQLVLSAQLGLENGSLAGQTLTGVVTFSFAGVQVGTASVNAMTLPATITMTSPYTVDSPAGSYPVSAVFTSANSNFTAGSAAGAIATIAAEDAVVTPDPANPTSVRVATPLGSSGPLTFAFTVSELSPEANVDQSLARPGDLSRTAARAVLMPSHTGVPVMVDCSGGPVTGSGYAQTRPFTCAGSGLRADTYHVVLQLIGTSAGSYYAGSRMSNLRVYDPTAETTALARTIAALVANGTLKSGNGNALGSKLDDVVAKIARGDDQAAINQLGAFINQVSALHLSGSVGDQLIAAAQTIIADLAK